MGHSEGTTADIDRVEESDSSHSSPTDLLEQLIGLSFDRETALLAIEFTQGSGIEAAVNWICENPVLIQDLFAGTMGANSSSQTSSTFPAHLFYRTGPHKMVFVVNTSLKMGAGKMAAQVGHAAVALYRLCQQGKQGNVALEQWNEHGEMKIVLKGEDTAQLEELHKKAAETQDIFAYLVHDAGHTQIPAGSRTVLGLFGQIEAVDQITGHLKLY